MDGTKKKKAIEMLAAGHTGQEVVRSTGVSKSAVSRLRNREDIKPLLDAGFRDLVIRTIGNAVDNTASIIEFAQKYLAEISKKETIDPEDFEKAKVLLDLAGKKEKRVFDAAGFGNPQTQSIHLLNITNNSNQLLSPKILELLKLAHQTDDDSIDVDLEIDGLDYAEE